jgi:hypothetical protein
MRFVHGWSSQSVPVLSFSERGTDMRVGAAPDPCRSYRRVQRFISTTNADMRSACPATAGLAGKWPRQTSSLCAPGRARITRSCPGRRTARYRRRDGPRWAVPFRRSGADAASVGSSSAMRRDRARARLRPKDPGGCAVPYPVSSEEEQYRLEAAADGDWARLRQRMACPIRSTRRVLKCQRPIGHSGRVGRYVIRQGQKARSEWRDLRRS